MTPRQQRIAILQHRRRQAATLDELARIASAASIEQLEPIPMAESFERSQLLSAKMRTLRDQRGLRRVRYQNVDQAVDGFMSRGGAFEDPVWQFYGGSRFAGLFTGHPDRELLKSWLEASHDGFAVFERDLSAGHVLDWAASDELEGTFAEVESW